MNQAQQLYHQHHKKGKVVVHLEGIYPLKILNIAETQVQRFIDDEVSNTSYANRLEIDLTTDQFVEVVLEPGFYASPDDDFTGLFLTPHLWTGGDGIYSFNLTGEDDFNAPKPSQSLFVFGDTFVGETDPTDFKRIEPTLMPNNSFAILNDKDITFHLEKGTNHSVKNVFDLAPDYAKKGTSIEHVLDDDETLYLSADKDEDVVIWIDLKDVKPVDKIAIGNYFDTAFEKMTERGLKSFELYQSDDQIEYRWVQSIPLQAAQNAEDKIFIPVKTTARYLKLIIPKHRSLIGFRYMGLHYQNQRYIDISITTNQVFFEKSLEAWLWLQDGIILDDTFYFYPMRVISDKNQPEGLQFKVLSTMIFKVPVHSKGFDLTQVVQKPMRNFYDRHGLNIMFGAAVMNHLKKDGYIYVYGYQSQLGFRQLLVSRVPKESIWDLDQYEYFDGQSFTSDFMKAAPVLDHVSCEMSVSYMNEGPHQGKYIAVMTYDTNTRYLAFSIGESPWGPFTPPQKIYVTPEPDIFKSTTYTYNAKAHPHLSSATDILVSYNTNTYNFDHNMSHAGIYRPRFIRLKTI